MPNIRLRIAATVVMATVATTAYVVVERPLQAHDAPHYSAGEPGDSNKPARTVVISMREGDGKMMFIPDRLEVRRNEQIRFILTNVGNLDHEFMLATVEENLKHAVEMQKNPDMEHDDANGKRIAPKRKAELVWRFTKVGVFEYGCLIPGHRESGMFGTIVVK